MNRLDSGLVVFEGPHGSGKTTQAMMLKRHLDERRIPAVITGEPYMPKLKDVIGQCSQGRVELCPYVLLYLHAADRFAHVRYIKEELRKGTVVISDRYLLSSYVYQQIQGLDVSLIEEANSFCMEPTVTFILDTPWKERKQRLDQAGRMRNTLFFTDESLSADGILYQDAFRRYREKWRNVLMIDGSRSADSTQREIASLFETI